MQHVQRAGWPARTYSLPASLLYLSATELCLLRYTIMTMTSYTHELSLQEPLVPFTWPPRDDPGWDIFDAGDEQADGASSHSSHRHEGSEGTSMLMDDANELAIVKTSEEGVGAVSQRDETLEDTLRRLCKAARKPVSPIHNACIYQANTFLAAGTRTRGQSLAMPSCCTRRTSRRESSGSARILLTSGHI